MPRILVLEDEAYVRLFLVEALRLGGHEVLTAENGVEGLRRFLSGDFDLVLCDLAMPEMNGATFIRTLRGMGSVVPVLILSGTPHDARFAVEPSMVQGVLGKPVDLQVLLGEVQSAILHAPDRRRDPRTPWVVQVRLVSRRGVEVSAWTTEVSPGGLRVNWEAPLGKAEVAEFHRALFETVARERIELPIEPAHSLDLPQTGFAFRLKTREDVALLGRLLASLGS